jgi:4-amino-4-deoxy-L-arabinose transferase-like glycosyltransferase
MPTLAVADRIALETEPRSPFMRVLGFVERSHARACAALLALALVCFLPGFVSLMPMDRDEPRFAQASKQMLESGDFVDIRVQDEARHKKPVGIHWMQSAAVAAAEAVGVPEARTTIALYRVPSLVGALGVVLLTYWAGLAFAGRREAFLAGAFMAASLVLMTEARLAKTDAMLTACSVAVMGGLARAYLARGVGRLPGATVAIFWAALAVGILVKGPLVLMFAALCALVLSVCERSPRWLLALRPALGVVLTVAIVAPWFLAIAVKTGGAYYTAAVGDDLLGKVAAGQQNHWAPPGYYLAAFFATFWPAAALAAMAAPFAWRQRRDDAFAFLLAWIVPSWIIFEAVSTKLPHYVLPLYPAIAIATAMAIRAGAVGPKSRGAKALALAMPFVPIGIALVLGYGAWKLDGVVPAAGLVVLAAATVTAIAGWRLFMSDDAQGAAMTGVAAAALVAVGAFGLLQPQLASLRLSERLAEVARRVDCPEPRLGTFGYREMSLVFLTRTDLRLLDDARQAAAFAGAGGCRVIFVESRREPAFVEELAQRGLTLAPAQRLAGFNMNGGRRLDIAAYVVKP